MKKVISFIIVLCLLFGTITLAGCSNTDTAALKEDYSNSKYDDWECFFTSVVKENEILNISRRHGNILFMHGTFFKITIYNDDVCTYYYETTIIPCQKGLLPCDGNLATLKDAAESDDNIAAIFPYVETVIANIIMQQMIEGFYDASQLDEILFKNMVTDWFEEYQSDILAELHTSAIGIVADSNDYLSKAVEIAFGVQDAADNAENTDDLETDDFAKLVMPWLSDIETGYKLIQFRIGFEHAKALDMLNSLSGVYAHGNLTLDNYEVKFDGVITALHDNFKAIMDDIDLQKAQKEAEKKKKWDDFWDDFFSFGKTDFN